MWTLWNMIYGLKLWCCGKFFKTSLLLFRLPLALLWKVSINVASYRACHIYSVCIPLKNFQIKEIIAFIKILDHPLLVASSLQWCEKWHCQMKVGMLIEKVRMHVSIWWVDLGVESQQNRRWYRQRGGPRIIGADWSRDKLSQAQCPANILGT